MAPTDSFWDMFFPLTAPLDILVTTLAVIGLIGCIARRNSIGTALGVIGLITVALVYLTRDSLPVIGLLWNPRLLPLIYFVRYLLMMVGVVEVVDVAVNLLARPGPARRGRVGRRLGDGRRRRPRRAADPRLHVRGAARRQPRRQPRRHQDGLRVGSVPEDRDRRRRSGRRLVALQLLRLRGPPAVPGVLRRRPDDVRDRRDQRLRPRRVGEQRGQRPVRHDDGADAAAALDRRLHRVDGGPLLRGVRAPRRTTS